MELFVSHWHCILPAAAILLVMLLPGGKGGGKDGS